MSKKPVRMSPAQVMFSRFSSTQELNSTQAKDKKEIAESVNVANKKRIAHIPSVNKTGSSDASNGPKRPVLPLEIGGKVPNTIRQRYLSLIIDECLKANMEPEKAYQKSLTEEQNIYKRSPSKNSYINLAVIAIKRIRDSAKAKDS